jgi:hypothetical protein
MTYENIEDILLPRFPFRDYSRQNLFLFMELVESIKKYGILHPIAVSENKVIISGVLRYFACRLLEFKTIPVVFHPGVIEGTTLASLLNEIKEKK